MTDYSDQTSAELEQALTAARSFQQEYFASHPAAHTHPAQDLTDVQPLLDAFDQLCAAQDYEAANTLLYGLPVQYMSDGDALTLYDLLSEWQEFGHRCTMLEQLAAAPPGTLRDSVRTAALHSVGHEYHMMGNYQRAIEIYRLVLAIMEQSSDLRGQASVLGDLGLAYQSLGEYALAVGCHTRSPGIKQQLGSRFGQAQTLSWLGRAYLAQEQYAPALDCYQQALYERSGLSDYVAGIDADITLIKQKMARAGGC